MMSWPALSILLGKAISVLGVAVVLGVGYLAIRRRAKADHSARRVLKDAVATGMADPHTLHPEIDPARCAGCGACVKACPEGEILGLIDHKAVLVSPTQCVGHGQCEVACPFGAITLVFGTKKRGMELPRLTTHFETNVPSLYIAGELGGMGLIRNAVRQGKMAAEHAAATIKPQSRADVDLLIVGAGPAGISASLAAIAARRSYLCIEQGSVGGTVYNFPRQKVVMSHPAELPLLGMMKFPGNKVSKEQLLAYWHQAQRRTGLKIHESCRFLGLEKHGDVFAVSTTKGLVSARKVILAMGVRGTPRRLNLPNEDLPKVTYNLLEPEQYQGLHVAVVGGGNAGVEAAQRLAHPSYRNRVTLLVRGERFDRCNQENQAIIKDLARQGLVKIRFNSSIQEIHHDHLVIQQDGAAHRLPNHFLFVFIGAELPFKFLQGLGVAIDKKFGEPLRKG